jgi:hypothetical protein
MSKDARNEDLELTAVEKENFGELVALLARHGFGEAGPPRETTFAQIEKFGHQAGQMVARAIDVRLTEQHAAHFAGEESCPTCGEKHLQKVSPHDLELQTEDGEVRLREPAFHCSPCERDFFPGAHSIAVGWTIFAGQAIVGAATLSR